MTSPCSVILIRPVRGARRRKDGTIGGTAAAPDAAAAPVKEFERDTVLLARLRQPFLGRIQAPIGREIATVFSAHSSSG